MTEAPLRLGAPPYLAARPCIEGLDEDPNVGLLLRTPSELVELLHSSTLDAALVSSIEAFRRPGYRFVPGVAIVSRSTVRSVLLFARKPLDECQSLALDPASRSGAALARIVLAERARPPVKVIELDTGSDPRSSGADCWLRIGDNALCEAHALTQNPGAGVSTHDLAELWRSLTGLPFVFALWLVRPGARFTAGHARALVKARDRGRARVNTFAESAAASLRLPVESLRSYLRDACVYDLDDPALAGLHEFHRRAAAAGLADPNIEPQALDV